MAKTWPICSRESGRSFRNSYIPGLAVEALKIEDKADAMLPGNLIVRETDNGPSAAAVIDPVASMPAIANPALARAAERVRTPNSCSLITGNDVCGRDNEFPT
jgi:hypothetical protein